VEKGGDRMDNRKQVITVVSIAVISFLIGTLFNMNLPAIGKDDDNDDGSPWDKVWTTISELQSKIVSLNTSLTKLQENLTEIMVVIDFSYPPTNLHMRFYGLSIQTAGAYTSEADKMHMSVSHEPNIGFATITIDKVYYQRGADETSYFCITIPLDVMVTNQTVTVWKSGSNNSVEILNKELALVAMLGKGAVTTSFDAEDIL